MPTYEYICEACAHEWEASQSIKDDPLKTCPRCKKRKAKRQISMGAGFILKGGGWYSDLYASAKKGGDGNKSDGDKSSAKSDASSDGGGDTSSSTDTASSSDSKSSKKKKAAKKAD